MNSIFDLKTLVFSTGFTCFVIALISLTFSKVLPSKSKSLITWSLALFLIGIAFGLFSVRGHVAPILSYYLANLVVITGASLFAVTFSLYYSKNKFIIPLLLTNVISFLFLSVDYWIYGEIINKQRPVYLLSIAIFYFSLCIYWTIKNEKPKMGIYPKLFITTYSFLIFFSLLRLLKILFGNPNARSFVENNHIQIVFMATVGIVVIFAGLSFLLMAFEQVQNEILKKTALAEQAHRLKSIGELAAGVAHEVNNPLAIISVSMENLKKQIPNDSQNLDKINKNINRANEAVLRVSKIVKGLLEFSDQKNSPTSQLISSNSIIDGTLALCREKFTAHDVRLEIMNGFEAQLYCQKVEIIQILLTLLDNALDATLKLNPDKRYVQIRTQKNENNLEFIVSNSGHQIPSNIRSQLFDSHISNRNPNFGMGLSLSLAKGIAERHHGQITFDSQPDTTTFVLSLPIGK